MLSESVLKMANKTLAQYDASVNCESCLSKGGNPLPIRIRESGKRLRFEGFESGKLVMSGPINEKTIESFVEKFWYWQKIK